MTYEIATIYQDLSKFQTDSVTSKAQIETSVTDCKDVKRADNYILIIDEANEVDQVDEVCLYITKFSTSTVIFGSNPVVDIENAYGQISGNLHVVSTPKFPDSVPQLSQQVSSKPATLDIVKKPDDLCHAQEVSSSDLGAVGGRDTNEQLHDPKGVETINKHHPKTRELLSDPIITNSIELSDDPHSLVIQQNGSIWYYTSMYKVYKIEFFFFFF